MLWVPLCIKSCRLIHFTNSRHYEQKARESMGAVHEDGDDSRIIQSTATHCKRLLQSKHKQNAQHAPLPLCPLPIDGSVPIRSSSLWLAGAPWSVPRILGREERGMHWCPAVSHSWARAAALTDRDSTVVTEDTTATGWTDTQSD